jgi:hypothetical protein
MQGGDFRSMMPKGQDGVVPMSQIDQYEKSFLQWLVNMHNALRKDNLNVDEIENLAEFLVQMKNEAGDDYLHSLIRPELSKGCKIPTTIPIPSSSFQMHNSRTFRPNANGHAALMFNPFFMSSNTGASTNALTTLYINNANTLTGAASDDNFVPVNMYQTIPAVYNEYRLVSASIVVKYIGRLDVVQGVIGAAIVFDSNVGSAQSDTGVSNPALAKYGNFNLAQDSYYFQERMTLSGVRELFFPLDTTFEQYRRVGPNQNDPKLGFSFLIYLQDGVYSGTTASNYKLDVYLNFECLPDATFLNYIPTSAPALPSGNKEHALKQVQREAITDADAGRGNYTGKPLSVWERIKGTIGKMLPSIAGIASSLIPGGSLIAPIAATVADIGSKALTLQQGRDRFDMLD